MTWNVWIQDLLILFALTAGILLYNATLVRKLNEKMDTLKVQSISRRFRAVSFGLMACLLASGALYQAGMVQGVAAYALVGTFGCLSLICLQVFNRFLR
jgi:hypothetical protein